MGERNAFCKLNSSDFITPQNRVNRAPRGYLAQATQGCLGGEGGGGQSYHMEARENMEY